MPQGRTTGLVGDDGGFTLIELLISISILAIVLGAVVTAIGVFLQTGPETSRRDDHSSGAATASSYLDRDLASADTIATSGTTCSGVTNRLVLSWTDYTSSVSSPSPSPTGGTWTVAYGLVSYVSNDVAGSPTRYELKRWYCPPGTATDSAPALMVTNLLATTDLTATTSTRADCPGTGTAATVVLKRYNTDAGSDYTFSGCLKGRRS